MSPKRKKKIFSRKKLKKTGAKALSTVGIKSSTHSSQTTTKAPFHAGIATNAFLQSSAQSQMRDKGSKAGKTVKMSISRIEEEEDEMERMDMDANFVVDPYDETAVGNFTCRVAPPVKVDVRSIGGSRYYELEKKREESSSNLLLGEDSKKPMANRRKGGGEATKKLTNECLYAMRVGKFEMIGGDAGIGQKKLPKAKNKLRYVCIIRSTNCPLREDRNRESHEAGGSHAHDAEEGSMQEEDDDTDDGYDKMFSPDPESAGGTSRPKKIKDKKTSSGSAIKSSSQLSSSNKPLVPLEDEISSFPALVLLAIHPDGSNLDIRKIIQLDLLCSVACHTTTTSSSPTDPSKTTIQMGFSNKDLIILDLTLNPPTTSRSAKPLSIEMHRDRFLWSLLQIHAILCTSVIERTPNQLRASNQLPTLTLKNVDKRDLQYNSTHNGFLDDLPILFALLERQRTQATQILQDTQHQEKEENLSGMAYDIMMGNYSRFALFSSPEEKQDAEDVLNAAPWQTATDKNPQKVDIPPEKLNIDPSSTSQALMTLLQKRMRDLEAETCRRLIAWEDEKHFADITLRNQRDCVDSPSLISLFQTLDQLDDQLSNMEQMLEAKTEKIRPLINDCKEIEEENRQLEQQFQSYDLLGQELSRILSGIEIPSELQHVLENPRSVLKMDSSGNINIEKSEEGIETIHHTGMALKNAINRAEMEGAMHLQAVRERVEKLIEAAKKFCDILARIVVDVMEQLASTIVSDLETGKISKTDTHTQMVKKIRDTQRRFQSSLLLYIKLIEVLSYLKPEILPAIRDAYAELVVEGILSKKRMKTYFSSLPCSSSTGLPDVTVDMKDYNPASLTKATTVENPLTMKPVNSEDVESALNEMLPVIAREAYFTAALFGLSGKKLDGREKKRNFESVKKSVDHSSTWFRYYISRICGIASAADALGKHVSGDPMLSLVASIHLNESMDQYIDRQKKGGDHSLSLAYVRATVFDLRKKVDKQWVSWVEEQIRWIRTNHGVPLNGKRAGVFPSFSKFPAYLDHVLICCRAGRDPKYVPNFSKIKVISYYLQKMAGELFASLHECAVRETTDQQYAANVMRMENSYFFTQSINRRGPEFCALFQKQITAATEICKQSTDAYLGWMIKREFRPLHSLFSNISRIRRDVGDADVPIHVPKATFVKTLSKESNREVMREKIGAIYARMEKHLSEQAGLLPVAWKALVKVLYEWFGRWEKLSTQCYGYGLDPSAVEVVRIAKAAGGVAGRKSIVKEVGQQQQQQNGVNKGGKVEVGYGNGNGKSYRNPRMQSGGSSAMSGGHMTKEL